MPRNRMHISQTQAFYMIINNRTLASMTKTMAEIYKEEKAEDGFLYIEYGSQVRSSLGVTGTTFASFSIVFLRFRRHLAQYRLPND